MPKFYDSLSDNLRDWALEQQVFFTASAPLAGKHINISPKGLPSSTFTIFDPNHAAYIDATGSGAETISHIYENGRITIMFCSFGAAPRIMRFFCTGRVVEWDQPVFDQLLAKMGKKEVKGARAVILLDIWKVQTSCGFGVPFLTSEESCETPATVTPILKDRETLGHWASKKIETESLQAYQAEWNADSLDGLTGMKAARRERGERMWITGLKARHRRIMAQREALLWGFAIGTFAMLSLVWLWQALQFWRLIL